AGAGTRTPAPTPPPSPTPTPIPTATPMPTATPGPGRTLFVDGAIGDDARSAAQAMSRTTPWRTIGRALAEAIADDKIVVAPGTVRRPSTISSPRAERQAASSRLSPCSRL